MLIQVDGWFGAGKGVLWMLLDGHPDIFCSPVHDYAYAAFLGQGDDFEWVKTRHTEILRKVLARTQYYKFEKVFWDGFTSLDFSSGVVLKIPYSLDYYRFDRDFMEKLVNAPEWTLEHITDTLYGSVFGHSVFAQEGRRLPSCFASCGNPLFIEEYARFPEVFPAGKSIQIRRGVEHIIAVRSNRKPREEDFKTRKFYSDSFETRMAEGEVEKILHYYDRYDLLVEKHPDIFKVVSFDDLMNSTESVMREICAFAGIAWHPELLRATYQGAEIVYGGMKYTDQVRDTAEELLTRKELDEIRQRVEAFRSRKVNPSTEPDSDAGNKI